MKSYILCSTPRTGSALLCALLQSSGVADVPESYFRKQDLSRYAEEWGIADPATGDFNFSDYLNAALDAGRTENGVFGVRIMWGTMDELTEDLSKLFANKQDATDKELLRYVFGDVRFLYIKRENTVAQAVSRLRAEQTDIWHVYDSEHQEKAKENIVYDFEKLHDFVNEAREHNEAWTHWFSQNDIQPYVLSYEALNTDPINVVTGVLDFLELKQLTAVEYNIENRRMADELSEEWIARYQQDLKSRS